MRIVDSDCHLTYCSNIHPGESWKETRGNLERYLPLVKRQVAPEQPFGIGLRLSAMAAKTLENPDILSEFKHFLVNAGLYVFTINGFPYGPFHGTRVKEEVYLPDWQNEKRLRYTNRLANLLTALLPPEPTLEGSVSTVPGAFKARAATAESRDRMCELLIRHAAHLVELRRQSGRTVALALEPEPCCFLETIAEAVAFFRDYLFGARGVNQLMAIAKLSKAEAEESLRRHLGICLDLCHAAVEFEDPFTCLDELCAAGIKIAKLQISAGLRVADVSESHAELLRPFADNIYLHQVVERMPVQGLTRYLDLPQAIAALSTSNRTREWRIHFHVPIFLEDFGTFSSTQSFIRTMLSLHQAKPISKHLEVETYTWSVLPERYRGMPVEDAIVRELNWVRERLAQ